MCNVRRLPCLLRERARGNAPDHEWGDWGEGRAGSWEGVEYEPSRSEGDARDGGARDDAPELMLLQFMEEIDRERAEHANQWQSVAISGNQWKSVAIRERAEHASRAPETAPNGFGLERRQPPPPPPPPPPPAAAAAGCARQRPFAIYVQLGICPRCARAKAPGLPAPASQLPFVIIESHVRCRTLLSID